MDNKENNFKEFEVPESGFIYGDDGPEVVPADFDEAKEVKNNTPQELDFPNESKAIQTNETKPEEHVTIYEEGFSKNEEGPKPIQGNPFKLKFPNTDETENVTRIDTSKQKEELIQEKKSLLEKLKEKFKGKKKGGLR